MHRNLLLGLLLVLFCCHPSEDIIALASQVNPNFFKG